MTTINDLLDSILSGNASDTKDHFNTLVRDSIDSKIDALRPAVHGSVFGAKPLEKPEPVTEAYHIKFKDKSNGQWFKSKDFSDEKEMTQHFWEKIKGVAGEVQFHGPKGRIAEDTVLGEDVTHLGEDLTSLVEWGDNDATMKINDRKFHTKKFADQGAAADFIRRNPGYGVLSTANGEVHVSRTKSAVAKADVRAKPKASPVKTEPTKKDDK